VLPPAIERSQPGAATTARHSAPIQQIARVRVWEARVWEARVRVWEVRVCEAR